MGKQALMGNPIESPARLKEELLKAAPDLDMFGGIHASYALDACACCDALLDFLISKDANSPSWAANLSIDTVYSFAGETGDLDPDMPLEDLRPIRTELAFQEALVSTLEQVDVQELMATLLDKEYDVSNIGLS